MAKIRLIVDSGEVNCPVCSTRVTAGHGHSCSDLGEVVSGCTFKIPASPRPYNPDGDNYPR